MPRKPKDTPKLRITEDGVWLGDKYEWQPPGFFVLKFTDIVARVAIQHYANLIATRDPQLCLDLTAAVEAAGSWGHQELNDYLCPPCEHDWVDARNEVVTEGEMCSKCGKVRTAADAVADPPIDHICVSEGCEPHDHGNATGTPCHSLDCEAFLKRHPQPVNGVTRPADAISD